MTKSANGNGSRSNGKKSAGIDSVTANVIEFGMQIIQEQDLGLHNHSKMVAGVARQIAIKLDLPHYMVEAVSHAAYIHDIGKLLLPYGILQKSEELTPAEWVIVKEHPVLSHKVTERFVKNPVILSAVVGHHERIDGSGYPYGTKPCIPAQIVGVSDIFIALQENRVYRPPLSRLSAVKDVMGRKFAPEVLDAFHAVCTARSRR